jgi:hypothetical protein
MLFLLAVSGFCADYFQGGGLALLFLSCYNGVWLASSSGG